MKNTSLFALLAVAGSTTAFAAPRESISLTNVPSITLQGNAANFIATLNATGSDGGGSYDAAAIRFSGTISAFRGASFAREAMIRVTPPTGTPFVIVPNTGTTVTPPVSVSNALTIPVSAVTTAGTWTFEFFDDFEDASASGTNASEATLGAYDALWSTVTIALDDAAPAAPSVGSGPSVTFTNVDSDGLAAAPAQTRTWNNTSAFTAALPAVRVRGRVVTLNGHPTNTNFNVPGNVRISITPPGGTAVAAWGADLTLTSMGTVDAVVPFPAATTLPGTWGFAFFEGTDNANGVDNQWIDVSFELVDRAPTNVVPVAADNTGAWVSATNTIASAGSVAWFSFTAPATLTATGYLDIDTFGTSLAPANDTDIALYLPSGALVDSDEDDSVNLLSQLSYGAGNRRRVLSGLDFTGVDGTIAAASTTGIAPGGNYFVAVAGGNAATHATGFGTAGGANTGSVTLRVRSQDSGSAIELPSATAISLTTDGAWNSASSTLAAGEIAWFSFTTAASLAASGGVDIDTIGSVLAPTNDTDIGLYTAAGVFVDSDEDDSTEQLSQLSYGPTGTRRNPPGNGLAFRGQDGTTAGGTGNLAASTQYYVAVAGGNSSTHASTFNTSGSTNAGSVSLRIRQWDVSAPFEPAVPPASESLTFPVAGGTTTVSTSIAAGGSKWYSLVVPVDINPLNNRALQIDNETSTTSPTANDTSIGLYRESGDLRASDTADGTDSIASLSFGVDDRVAPGNGLAYNGRDGVLLAGTYYLNVSAGGAPTFGGEFGVSALSGTQSGTVVTNVRYFAPSVADGTPPAVFTDAGTIVKRANETESVYTFTAVPTNLNVVEWVRFVLPAGAPAAGPGYLDIDTEGTNPTLNAIGAVEDSEIGVFTNGGILLASDDDDGSGWRTALSFGATTPVRAAINSAPQTGAVARNGRDGELLAGTYWAAVCTNDIAYLATNFGVTPPTNRSTTNTVARVLNFRTNIVLPQCTLSDVAGANQSVGPDNRLTADDIIVFLSWYFGSDARADVAGPNQSTTPDAALTADDIIVFLSRYFAGC